MAAASRSSSVLPTSATVSRSLDKEKPQRGIFDFFWPHIVNSDGEINHKSLTRRMETVLGLLGPSMAAVYTALECCHCPHSGIITLVCCVPIPVVFAEAIEYRAAVVSARIKGLVKKELPSSQAPPDNDIREQAEQLLKDAYEGVAASSSLALKLAPVLVEPLKQASSSESPPQRLRSSLKKRTSNVSAQASERDLAALADFKPRIQIIDLDPKHAAHDHPAGSLNELKSSTA